MWDWDICIQRRDIYDREEAKRAKDGAEKVFRFAKELAENLEKKTSSAPQGMPVNFKPQDSGKCHAEDG